MTGDDDRTLSPGERWTETAFERGPYGPGDRAGLAATFAGEDATLSVLPVRYRVADGRERVRAIEGDFAAERDEPTASRPDVGPTTAFAVRARASPYARPRESVVCVAAAADDALAVACWLAAASDDAAALDRNVRLHAGTTPPSRTTPTLGDDDVLAALFAGVPERCVLTGTPTSSHRVRVPYRYVPLLDGAKRTKRDVPRFPSSVAGLDGVVSHAAWEDAGLADVDFGTPLTREGPGEFRLAEDVASVLAGVAAGRFVLARPDDG